MSAAPEPSPAEQAVIDRFDVAEPAPESYVHEQRDDCDAFCMAPFGSHHPRCGIAALNAS